MWHSRESNLRMPVIGRDVSNDLDDPSREEYRVARGEYWVRCAGADYLTQRAQRSKGRRDARARCSRLRAQRARTNFSLGLPLGTPREASRASVPKKIRARS